MGFSPSTKHTTTTSIFSNIVDADTGSFVTSLTVSGVSVRGIQYSYLREEQASGVNGGTFAQHQGCRRDRNYAFVRSIHPSGRDLQHQGEGASNTMRQE